MKLTKSSLGLFLFRFKVLLMGLIFGFVMQIGQSHPTGLTANLLKLFEPRPPLEFKPPPEKRKCPPLTGLMDLLERVFGVVFDLTFFFVCYNMICLSSYIIYEGMAQFVTKFAEPGDAEYSPPVVLGETPVRCYTSAGFDPCSSVLH